MIMEELDKSVTGYNDEHITIKFFSDDVLLLFNSLEAVK